MSSQTNQVLQDYPLYVASKAVVTGEWLEVQDKYKQEKFARVALADAKTIEKAIKAAVKAEIAMAELKPFEKQKILLHCVRRFNEMRDELTEILIAEGGKPRKAAAAEVERSQNKHSKELNSIQYICFSRSIGTVYNANFKQSHSFFHFIRIFIRHKDI